MNELAALFDYDRSFDPAFPLIELTLGSPATKDSASVNAYVDSGSDVSLMPLDALQHVGAEVVNRVWIRGLFGEARAVNLYLVSIQIGPVRIHGVQVGGIAEQGDVIIGRDVLNQLVVMLDGPADSLGIYTS